MNELLSQLLALPEPEFGNFDEIDYSEIATDERTEALVEVASSGEILEDLDDEAADHAIVHAVRALASRRDMQFFGLFVSILRAAVLYSDDLLTEDFIKAMVRTGPKAAPDLLVLLHDQDELEPVRTTVVMALDDLADDDAVRDTILENYVRYLEGKHPTRDINAFLTTTLIEHHAGDQFPVVRELYAHNLINVHIAGDLEEAEVRFGLRESRSSDKPDFCNLETQLAFEARRDMLGLIPDAGDPLDIIAYFLKLYGSRHGMQSVSQVDGFLLACAAAPQLILPSRYMPFIWDQHGGPDAGPIWETMEDANLFNRSLMDLHNKEIGNLQDAAFAPVVMCEGPEEDAPASYHDWALGVMIGVSLWDITTAGVQTLSDELIGALMELSEAEETSDDLAGSPGKPAAQRAFMLMLEAYEKHRQIPGSGSATRYFSERQPHERDAPKIGRNDPCPCGSGKKFKKCCMN